MKNYKKYTKEDIIKAVKSSKSIAQVLIKLKLAAKGGNYENIKRKFKELNIDTSHFTGQLWSKGIRIGEKYPTSDYLNNLRTICSHKLKKRLIREKYFKHKCYNCNLTKWNKLQIPLELEHINGNHNDNSLTNLTLLCPNCHAQTSTYRGKNIKK